MACSRDQAQVKVCGLLALFKQAALVYHGGAKVVDCCGASPVWL